MKYAFGAILTIAALWMTSAASAQTGLYGSPELIPLPAMRGGAPQQPAYASPAAMQAPATATYPAATTPYATVPVSYGQGTTGPSLGPAQGFPNYLAQATPEPPAPLAPEAVPPAPAPLNAQPPLTPQPVPEGPSVLDQLLQESGGAPGPACAAASDGGYNCGGSPVCAEGGECEPCFRSPWYVWTAGLYLTRDHANRVWTTYETGNNPNQLMNTDDADADWKGGGEIRLGRRFCCDQWAIEGTFWAVDVLDGYAAIASPGGGLSTPFDFDGLPGPGALFDNADAQILRRRDEIYNTEINLLRTPLSCGPLNLDWMVGFRWFHFREHLNFASLRGGGDWSVPTDVGYIDDRIQNNLLGGQVGLSAKYYLGYNLSLFARPKVGLYNNRIEHQFNIYDGTGTSFQPTDPTIGRFPGESSTNCVSVLTEIDVGVDWRFHEQWSAFIGYRLMAATGIGLADNQYPQYMVDVPEWEHIDDNGQLILHGAFAGLQYSF